MPAAGGSASSWVPHGGIPATGGAGRRSRTGRPAGWDWRTQPVAVDGPVSHSPGAAGAWCCGRLDLRGKPKQRAAPATSRTPPSVVGELRLLPRLVAVDEGL